MSLINHFFLLNTDGSSANPTSITTASNDSNSSGSFNPSTSHHSQSAVLNASAESVDPTLFGFAATELPRLMSNPSLAAFLYGRMPSSLSQLEVAQLEHRQQTINLSRQNANIAAAAERRQEMQITRSPSPVMSEEDAFRLCMARVESGKPCEPNCRIHPLEHFHCRSDGCDRLSFR